MEKILITTIGTRGDIQPYIGLSQKLLDFGYSVTLATNIKYESLVKKYDVPFCAIGNKKENSGQYIENLLEKNKTSSINEGLNLLFKGMKESYNHIMSLCKNHDIVIGHGFIGETEAEMNNLPFIRVSISPNLAQKKLWRSKNIFTNILVILEKIAVNSLIIKRYNRFREDVGAKKINIDEYSSKPVLLPMSRHLVKSNKSWASHNYLTGYWHTEEPESFEPPEDLVRFIETHNNTAVMTFGSMSWGELDMKSVAELITDVSIKTNTPMIVVGWSDDLKKHLNTDSVYHIDSIPYSWLFKQDVFCVIHHCGLGTTSEVLRGGLASIPVPHLIDQYYWSKKLYKMSLASKPLDKKKLTSETLSKRILDIKEKTFISENCKKLSKKINEELQANKILEVLQLISD